MGHSMSGVGVLDKAVVILAACVDGASLAELVERTKLPRATAHRLAQALEIHRLLVRDQQGPWRPGPRRGWAQSVAEREAGVASVSAPIRDRTGRVIAAISVSGPIERLGRRPGDRHAMAVVRAGQRLSGL